MSLSMSHYLGIQHALYGQFFRLPARWTCKKGDAGDLRFCCTVEEDLLTDQQGEENLLKLDEVDPWKWRLKFLDIDSSNPEILLGFLNDVGYYGRLLPPTTDDQPVVVILGEDGKHVYGYRPKFYEHQELLNDHEFCKDWPCHIAEPNLASLELRGGFKDRSPAMFITTASFYDMFQAAFVIDQFSHAHVKKCERPNCARTFSYTGKRKRKFCSYTCAHWTAVRRSRKRKGRRSKRIR